MKNTLLTTLLTIALIITGNHLCFAQVSPAKSPQNAQGKLTKQEKIKKQVENIGVGGKITVIKINKQKFFGTVTEIFDDGFKIREVDLKTELEFKYSDLKSIYKGDGERNLITGKRNNPQKGWLYGGAVIGSLIVILIIGVSDKDF
jgi:hypothetical protein